MWLPWGILILSAGMAFGCCWGALRFLLLQLPIDAGKARVLAKDWTTIGASVLAGWSVLALAAGPNYPLVTSGTTFVVGGAFLLFSTRMKGERESRNSEQNELKPYLLVWLLFTAASGLLAYGVLWMLSNMFIVPAPDPGA
jgi:hypothetical protein